MTDPEERTALVVGASRALGLGLVQELAGRGWHVIGTVRGASRTPLHDAAERSGGRIEVEVLDMTAPETMTALRARLEGRSLDLLFVSGGITTPDEPAEQLDADAFAQLMTTNALGPVKVLAALDDLVPPTGTIGVMSSRQGSIAMNDAGGYDAYRASKSALNQLVRSRAARHADDPRTLLLIHPGHVQTDLGGSGAPLTVADSARGVVDVLVAQSGAGGLQFLSHTGETLPW